MPRILLIVLSEPPPDGAQYCLSIFATCYYGFRDANFEVVLASVAGGFLFLDQSTTIYPEGAASLARFQADRDARDDLADTICIDAVHADDFDGVMYLGTTAELPERVMTLICDLLSSGKPAAVLPCPPAVAADNGILITGGRAELSPGAASALISVLSQRFPSA